MTELITIITTDSHDIYPWLVRRICRVRGIPVPRAGHVRLAVNGKVYELTTVGILERNLDEYFDENSDTVCSVVCVRVSFASLVVDRILTLAMANIRLRWWRILEVLLTGKSEGMFCTDLPLVVLGLKRGERPLTPPEMVNLLRSAYDATEYSRPN